MADSLDIFDRILARPPVAVGRGRHMSKFAALQMAGRVRRLIERASDPQASEMNRREALQQMEIEWDGLRAHGWIMDRYGNVTRTSRRR